MHRREFLSLIGGAAATWPLHARAQQRERIRRVGLLLACSEQDKNPRVWVARLVRALQELGWEDGRNIHVTYGWAGTEHARLRETARSLVASGCDVIVVESNPGVIALREVNRTIPVVFVLVGDAVGSGFVESLSKPGGNLTGFEAMPPEMGGKWMELIKELAPATNHVMAIFDPEIKANSYYLESARAAASVYNIVFTTVAVRSTSEVKHAVTTLAGAPNGALMILPNPRAGANRGLLAKLTTKYLVPSIYPYPIYPKIGGLLAYGPDIGYLFQRTASYVDRILRGEKPADLPIQRPTKFELIINLKTAKKLGLTVPPLILVRADEVIE